MAAIAAASIRSPIRSGDDDRAEQEPHQRVGELPQRDRRVCGRVGSRKPVRAEPHEARGGLGVAQAALEIRVELARDVLGGERVRGSSSSSEIGDGSVNRRRRPAELGRVLSAQVEGDRQEQQIPPTSSRDRT